MGLFYIFKEGEFMKFALGLMFGAGISLVSGICGAIMAAGGMITANEFVPTCRPKYGYGIRTSKVNY